MRKATSGTPTWRFKKPPGIKPLRGLCLTAWEQVLGDDFDKDFLLNGIKFGFDIVDVDSEPQPVELDNHPSASPQSPLFQQASKQVEQEIINQNYIEVDSPPIIVSPLGAIPKPDGGVRLIHDCSRPQGSAVNDYVSAFDKQRFQSVDDACKLVKEGFYMAKVDLKWAYRSVNISKHSQLFTGLKWQFQGKTKYFYDGKLPFGSKLAPGIFHRLSQAVRRMMSRKGFNIVAYLDDFFICEATKDLCSKGLRSLVQLLRKLGFLINWNKVVDPTNSLTFLGVQICSREMCLRLPSDKLHALRAELDSFGARKRASKKQLQSLVGKLNWAAAVVHGGRVFLRRLIDAINSLKQQSHKIRLDNNIKDDIVWWQRFLLLFNGKAIIPMTTSFSGVYTDACNSGAGAHWGEDWYYCNWERDWPLVADWHINDKEILAVVLAAHIWGSRWANRCIYVFSDNMTTVSNINKGTSKNKVIMHYLRYLFWVSARFNFRLRARHIKGINNRHADLISRLGEVNKDLALHRLSSPSYPGDSIWHHISPQSFFYILSRHGAGLSDEDSGYSSSSPAVLCTG